jgi:hypothetical protein
MKPAQLSALVDEGITLRLEIDTREKRLKEIEKQLKAHAEANPEDHVPLKDEEREGTRLLCAGSRGIVPVIFTSDLLMQSIPEGSDKLEELTALAGETLGQFYVRSVAYTAAHTKAGKFDGKAFRAAARELLPDPERFIAACVRRNRDGIPVSQTKVAWDEVTTAA